MLSSHLEKTASKSVHPLGWTFVHKQSRTHTHTHTLTHTPTHIHTNTHTHTPTHTHPHTDCSENINPSRFRGGVINKQKNLQFYTFVYINHDLNSLYYRLSVVNVTRPLKPVISGQTRLASPDTTFKRFGHIQHGQLGHLP